MGAPPLGNETHKLLADGGIERRFGVGGERLLPDAGGALRGVLGAGLDPRTVVLRGGDERAIEGGLDGFQGARRTEKVAAGADVRQFIEG